MKKRLFGKSGVQVSEIGLGCWQLGGSDWGAIDDQSALDILAAAAEQGITFLDTADVYGMGRSETLIGQFLKQRREKFFVATKLGRMGGLYPDKYSEKGVRDATEASLKRLGVEALDLTQLHCIPPQYLRQGEVFEWLRKLKDEGKIKNFGASVETVEEAKICMRQDGLCSLQIIFNIFRQKPIAEVFAEAREKNVGIIARLPLASGVLSGKMTKTQKFPDNDHRNFNRDGQMFNVGETFAGIPFEKAVELADKIKPLAPSGMNLADMAQRWVLDHPAVSTVITGASRAEQAVANARVSASLALSPALHEQLSRFYAADVMKHIRGAY